MNERFYDLCCNVLRPIAHILFPMKVDGLENIPETGGFILCCNHLSMVDPVYLAVSVRNRRIHFMAKAEVFKTKILGPIATAVGSFPVDRGHSDLHAVRTSLKLLSEGRPLGIFPQGTRSKGNIRTPMLGGVSMIALRAGVPVIPAYIHGPYKAFRKSYIRFGKPVDLSSFGRRFDADTMNKVTQAIDDAVWSMAPSENAK